MSDIILSVRKLEKTYISKNESLTIFRDLDMDVREGEKRVIVGKSGSGKSTLLNIIGGIDSATSGGIFFRGRDISRLSEKELSSFRKHDVGFVFQFHHLLKDFTSLENVFLPAIMAGVPRKEAVERAMELLDAVGLSDRSGHLPSELSGGERQRVAVARSLVNEPGLVLADEPTGNLDPANSEAVGNLLFSLSEKYGRTLILVTHDMNLAAKGDVRCFIENGTLKEER